MSGITVTVRTAALPAWEALQDVLRDSPPVACAGRSEWTSDDPEEREYAANRCRSCPALAACRAFAISNQEPAHVWGGIDFGDRRAVRSITNRKESA